MELEVPRPAVLPPWELADEAQPLMTETVKRLASELYGRISRKTYSYGTRLPAERQLAQEFGVSRNTVRQALELLERHRIIVRRPGSGSFATLRPPSDKAPAPVPPSEAVESQIGDMAEITSPLELNVVRTIVEPEMARLATINMSARDLARLKDILAKLESITTNAALFAEWDERFFMAIAEGTHNPLLIAIYRLVNHVRRHAHWAVTKEKTLSPSRIRDFQKKHRSLYEALEARDMESVIEFIKLHLAEVHRDLMRG